MSVKTFLFVKLEFKSSTHITNFLQFKDKMSYCLRSNVIYKFCWGRSNAIYFAETCRHLGVRVGKHSGVSPLTGKKSKTKESTAVKDHMPFCDYIVSYCIISKLWKPETQISMLTLFRMSDGGKKPPPPPNSFPPVTSTNVEISPPNFQTFSFNPFAILV